MSNDRFLEIDSTYRNREQFPCPSNFEVTISQTGTKGKKNALDPVSLNSPLITWSPSTILLPGTVANNLCNTVDKLIVYFPQPTNRNVNFYRELLFTIGIETSAVSDATYLSTNSSNEDCYLIQFENKFTTIPLPGTSVIPQPIFNMIDGLIWIPQSILADNYYTNKILWNNTLQQGVTLISYDGVTAIAGFDVVTNLFVAGWLSTHTYTIRNKSPKDFGTLPVPILPQINTLYTVALPPTFSDIEDFYVGDFLYITSGSNTGEIKRIRAYTSVTDTITGPRVVILSTNLTNVPVGGETFEILTFNKDNVVPFTYNGSLVSVQQMVCYEIELMGLSLPNITLTNGGRIAFYPFVYVVLQNVTAASSSNKNIIYSNNPNTTYVLFRAGVDDINNPLITPFIRIDGGGSVQTVKFRPNDSFRFSVILPDGVKFQTLTKETFSPLPPNPLIQISAYFRLKRL